MSRKITNYAGQIIVTVLAIVIAVVITLGGWGPSPPQEDGDSQAAMPKTPVSVMQAKFQRGIEITAAYSGMIRPRERFALGFEIAGRVGTLGVNEDNERLDDGDRVGRGQVLAQLDDRQLRAQLEEADARHKTAQAQLKSAGEKIKESEALRDQAKLDMERADRLKAYGQGAIAASDYLQYATQLAVTKAQLAQAESQKNLAGAQLAQAKAQVDTATKILADTKLLAPVDAVITKRSINPGESVSPHQVVMELVELEEKSREGETRREIDVLLVVGVPEAHIRQIQVGQKVHVELLARDRFRRKRPQVDGYVYQVAEAADQTSGLFEVEIWLPNVHGQWKPGLIGLAHVVINEVSGYRIPMTAAIFRGRQAFLFTVDEAGKAHRFDLPDWIEQGPDLIVDALPAGGDTVVVRGQHRLVDGCSIEEVLPNGKKPAKTPSKTRKGAATSIADKNVRANAGAPGKPGG